MNCGCQKCLDDKMEVAWWMISCSVCGNKRCPRAKDHRFKCSGSNDPNQVGVLAESEEQAMIINQAGLDLIKEFEGFRAQTYDDGVGVLTIGYGTTAAADVGIRPRPGMTVTQEEAEWYLQKALTKFAQQIKPQIAAPINENEFAAFMSLAYNIGPTAFAKSSALRHFNAGDKAKAAKAILLWNKAGGKVLKGLVRRREAERKLFLTPVPQPIIGMDAPKPSWKVALFGDIMSLLKRFKR